MEHATRTAFSVITTAGQTADQGIYSIFHTIQLTGSTFVERWRFGREDRLSVTRLPRRYQHAPLMLPRKAKSTLEGLGSFQLTRLAFLEEDDGWRACCCGVRCAGSGEDERIGSSSTHETYGMHNDRDDCGIFESQCPSMPCAVSFILQATPLPTQDMTFV